MGMVCSNIIWRKLKEELLKICSEVSGGTDSVENSGEFKTEILLPCENSLSQMNSSFM